MTITKSYIKVYNRGGQPITELRLPCTRSWLAGEFGTAEFAIPLTHDDIDKMQYRNPVTIMSNGLPLWVGFIGLPYQEYPEDRHAVVTAYSPEMILSVRESPGLSGSAGDCFRQIINYANFSDNTLIQVGSVFESIQTFTDLAKPPATLFDAFRSLTSQSGLEYEFVPNSAGGQLSITANLSARISQTISGFALEEGINVERAKSMGYVEQGQIANRVSVYRNSGTGGYQKTYFVEDADSIAQYGVCELPLTVDANSQISDSLLASTALTASKQPTKSIPLRVSNRNDTFQYLRLGNEIRVITHSIGRTGNKRGTNALRRITGMVYDDRTNLVTLTTEEIRV